MSPWVDEMIVVDTGAVDRTPKIARELGAVVYEFPWCDDFSVACNVSLEQAHGDWIFWMDSDDTIPPECGEQLRALVQGELLLKTGQLKSLWQHLNNWDQQQTFPVEQHYHSNSNSGNSFPVRHCC